MRYTNDRDARCPFFHAHGDGFVICEGVIPGTKSKNSFPGKDVKEIQYREFCCKRWRNCEHARAVMEEKYGDKNE